MKSWSSSAKVVSKLMFRLLSVQILLAAVRSVNGIVSSFFASNYVGLTAMSAVGLYAPVNALIVALCDLLSGGSAILCGKYMGRNEPDKVQNVFSLNLLISALTAAFLSVLFLLLGLFDLTGFCTQDEAVRPLFNSYLLGQVIGMFPLMLGNQLPYYLSMENRQDRTLTASIVYIVVNVLLNYLFVQVLRLEAFGLALASSLGLWVFFAVQAQAFMGKKTSLHLLPRHVNWREGTEIVRIGLPGAASNCYETVRRIIVNYLLGTFIGSAAISAFAASDSLLRIFWSVPIGMLAVSRMMISISIGEEDRQTLADVMRIMFRRFVPIMYAIAVVIILCAEPFTRLFFHDPSQDVYWMTVWGFRILPLCMPLSIICMHFMCYGQASGKTTLVHILALLDGLVCVAGFTALLIRWLGINSVYVANVLNGIVCLIVAVVYSCIKLKHFPTNMEELMVIPDDFGAGPDERIDLAVRSMEEVLTVSRQITDFCRSRGIEERKAYLASLCMEEMAGNIVEHGFTKDRKSHSIDLRVVHKGDTVILRIRDNCVPFNPQERKELSDPNDVMKNIGIRMVYKCAESVEYQNLLGLNVLTIRI